MSKDVFVPERREAFHPVAWPRISEYAATLMLGSARDRSYTLDLAARRQLAEAELAWLHVSLRDTADRLGRWRDELATLRRSLATLHLPRAGRGSPPETRTELEIRCRRIERSLERWQRFEAQVQHLRRQLGYWLLASRDQAHGSELRLAS